jgi:porphobilinogen synthase
LGLAVHGADCIAPSDMMDGRIAAIRNKLNENNFDRVTIMSYSAKFSSSFYGPFRDVCKSSPNLQIKLKNRKSYQISIDNPRDAIASSIRDVQEGSDIVMVKPGIPYLDIVAALKNKIHIPIAVYQVSGEYQSIELLAQHNLLKRKEGHLEVWTSMIRAGANIIISYASRNVKEWIAI